MPIQYNPLYLQMMDWSARRAAARNPAAAPAASSSLPGASPFNYSPEYGGIPQTPNPMVIGPMVYNQDPSAFQKLSRDTALANQQNLIDQYNRGLPNYNALLGSSSANIGANLAGQLDKNVQNYLWQQAAERGVAKGLPGSQFATYGGLMNTRDVMLQLQAQGQNQLNAAIGRTPIGQGLNAEQWLVTPQQQWEAQNLANTIYSAPVPYAAGRSAWNAANSGMNRGLNTPYAQPSQVYGDQNQQTRKMLQDFMDRYLGGGRSSGRGGTATPTSTGGGWAQTWRTGDSQRYSTGNVPQQYSEWNTQGGPARYDYGMPNYYNQPAYANPGGNYDQATADYMAYFGEEY